MALTSQLSRTQHPAFSSTAGQPAQPSTCPGQSPAALPHHHWAARNTTAPSPLPAAPCLPAWHQRQATRISSCIPRAPLRHQEMTCHHQMAKASSKATAKGHTDQTPPLPSRSCSSALGGSDASQAVAGGTAIYYLPLSIILGFIYYVCKNGNTLASECLLGIQYPYYSKCFFLHN